MKLKARKSKAVQVIQNRLEKKRKKAEQNYISKKLSKEKGNELMQRLSESSFSNTLLLSSNSLGKQPTKTKRSCELASDDLTEETFEIICKKNEIHVLNTSHTSSDNDYDIFSSEEEIDRVEAPYAIKSDLSSIEEGSNIKVSQILNRLTQIEKLSAHFVQISDRAEELQLSRMSLPIYQEESNFIALINTFPIVLIHGETGSGKTTQIPQFLYEAGFGSATNPLTWKRGKICVTQPRRLAAISMSKRVSEELGPTHGTRVGYQVRYDSNCRVSYGDPKIDDYSNIIFMTDGILLREISRDFLLKDWSVIILDEAHERNINTDILIGLVSRICSYREKEYFKALENSEEPIIGPLKLIIMSATLAEADFQNSKLFTKSIFPSLSYLDDSIFKMVSQRPIEEPISLVNFPFPPVLKISGRQHPVTLHFNRTTPFDYIKEAYDKVLQIHKSFPLPGNILVFVTGRKEVWQLVQMLKNDAETHTDSKASVDGLAFDSENFDDLETQDYKHVCDEETSFFEGSSLKILPLYSLLSESEQAKIFQGVSSDNQRICIVATNVAETSLTLPDIRYVVDCGKVKSVSVSSQQQQRKTYHVEWISKASADQRSGRAGRTAPGHCYRLYSSAVFHEIFEDQTLPEITRVPLTELVLHMKSLNIDEVRDFPFITQPDTEALDFAEQQLVLLGALETKGIATLAYKITVLGLQMAQFPIMPSHAKMILAAASLEQTPFNHSILALSIIFVSLLAIGDIFLNDSSKAESPSVATFISRNNVPSDFSILLNVFIQFQQQPKNERINWCREHGIRHKALEEAVLLIRHLKSIMTGIFPSLKIVDSTNISLSKETEESMIILFLTCHPQNIACVDLDRTASASAHAKGKKSYHEIYQLLNLCKGEFLPKMLCEGNIYSRINKYSSLHYAKAKYSAVYSPFFIGYEYSLTMASASMPPDISVKNTELPLSMLRNCFRIKHEWFFDYLQPFLNKRRTGEVFFAATQWKLK